MEARACDILLVWIYLGSTPVHSTRSVYFKTGYQERFDITLKHKPDHRNRSCNEMLVCWHVILMPRDALDEQFSSSIWALYSPCGHSPTKIGRSASMSGSWCKKYFRYTLSHAADRFLLLGTCVLISFLWYNQGTSELRWPKHYTSPAATACATYLYSMKGVW